LDPTQTTRSSAGRRPLVYLALLLALALPIWGLSRFVGLIGALKAPVTDLLLAFTPLTAAAILVLRDEGVGGLARFLGRAFDIRNLVRSGWMPVALLLAPMIYLMTVVGLHLAGYGGAARINWLALPVISAIIVLLAVGEEAGWTGYLLDPLQDRFGAVGASLIIAVPWWLGHIPSILAIGGDPTDLAWWIPGALALRILMTWLYNNAGRALSAAVLFHAMLNIGRIMTYPTVGDHYDPRYQATGYVIASILALVVVAGWGARSLTGRRAPAGTS